MISVLERGNRRAVCSEQSSARSRNTGPKAGGKKRKKKYVRDSRDVNKKKKKFKRTERVERVDCRARKEGVAIAGKGLRGWFYDTNSRFTTSIAGKLASAFFSPTSLPARFNPFPGPEKRGITGPSTTRELTTASGLSCYKPGFTGHPSPL